jgi:glucose uptake protein GlcU
MKLKTTQKITIAIVIVCLLWYCSTLLSVFRYSNYRWLYHLGWTSSYLFSASALVLSIINVFSILREFKQNLKMSLLLISISSIPLLFWVYVFISISGFKTT